MNLKKSISGLVGAVALMACVAAPSMAQQQTTFASVTGTSAGSNPNGSSGVFSFSGGATGAFSVTSGSIFSAQFLGTPFSQTLASVSFGAGSLTALGMATGTGTGLDPYTEQLSGGTFTVTQSGTSTVLLSGTFGNGNILQGASGSGTSSITNTITNVVYTGGTYFMQSGLSNPGSFSISMTSVTPTLGVTGGYLNAFRAGGTGTFSAGPLATVPEPSAYAAFGIAGLGLLGLMVRGRKTRRMAA